MTRNITARLRRVLAKNADEIVTLLTGRMPRFVLRAAPRVDELPVFVFHDVDSDRFEAQLRFLDTNGYRSLDADGVEEAVRTGRVVDREVALTFDDGTSDFWTVAFPLLKQYGFRAILFVIPGLVPEDSELARARAPLCTWTELATMHASGLVDVQSHSMTHARVAVSSRIVEFLHPGFDVESYGNVSIPLSSSDDPRQPSRRLLPGAPVFASDSRMAGRPRFVEDPAIATALCAHVREQGGDRFFRGGGWRNELRRICRRFPAAGRGALETREETERALAWELGESRAALERVLGKSIRHFCYPWFQGSSVADRLAREAGYASVHYGARLDGAAEPEAPTRVRRISEEYLFRLPGQGRIPVASVWSGRLRGFLSRN